VKLVMHEERCKADEANGRGSFTWTAGTRLGGDDVEGKQRAVEEGLKYAARDAGAYEQRCLLEAQVVEIERVNPGGAGGALMGGVSVGAAPEGFARGSRTVGAAQVGGEM
jgi:hypothetical protein